MHRLALTFLLLCYQQFADAATYFGEFDIAQQEVQVSPGVYRNKTVVNGLFPGPLIRVPYNSETSINVHNNLTSNATTIHWHGLHQRGTPYSDGFNAQTQCPIAMQKNMTYNFKAYPGGSTFWHAHFHGENADGVYGPFVVEDEIGTFPYYYDEERVIVLADAYDLSSWTVFGDIGAKLKSAFGTNQFVTDPPPDRGFICVYNETQCPATPSCSSTTDGNGFSLNFEYGKTYRLRLICSAALAPFVFSIDEHELQVVAVDYSVVDGSAWVQGVPMMTGQRYDVLVHSRKDVQEGEKFWVRGTIQSHCSEFSSGTINTDIRGIVTYGNKTSSSLPESTSWNLTNTNCSDLDYSTLKPASTSLSPASSDVEPALTLFINYTFPSFVNGATVIQIDGQVYNVSDDAYPTLFHIQEDPSWRPTVSGEQRNLLVIPDSVRGKQVRLVLSSLPARDAGGHPFHTHGRGLKILAVGNGNITRADLDNVTDEVVLNAVTRDTFVIHKNGWAITQFTADNPGVWAIHCHIVWHLWAGMVSQTVELPNAIASEITIPQELKDMCK